MTGLLSPRGAQRKSAAAIDESLKGEPMKYKMTFEEYLRTSAANGPKGLPARMLRMTQSELFALIGTATPSQGASPQTRKHELVDLVTTWRNYDRYKA